MNTNILTFWFPKGDQTDYQEFWFDCSKDIEIYEKFNSYLENKHDINPEILTKSEILAYIILYDQISRNIKRITNHDNTYYDNIAITLSQYILDNKYDTSYPFVYRMFILLPFRHSRKTINLNLVKNKLEIYKKNEHLLDNKLFQKFYLATLKDYSKVTDTIQIIYPIKQNISNHSNIILYLLNVIWHFILYICQINPIKYNKNIHDPLCKSFILKQSDDILLQNKLYQSIKYFVNKHNIKNIGISLSGGVDSNVLMFLCEHLRKKNILNNVIAIHVDYGNRDSSNLEAQYLIDICNKMNIPIVTRRITHMQRFGNGNSDTINREFYETETKAIRYGLYKYAITEFNLDGICLGHHKDDLTENIFMNIFRGKDLLELNGMTKYNNINGVNILRPMLDHIKDDIYEISTNYNIMYFKDITPSWSFRGFMRNDIFPLICKFDNKMLNNLNDIGEKSYQWNHIINNLAINPILSNMKKYKLGFTIDFSDEYKGLSIVFWSKVLVQLFHSNGVKMITKKNLINFIKWLNMNNDHLYKLSNNIIVTKYNNKLYFFNLHIMTIHDLISNITVNTKQIFKIGNWLIHIEPTTEYINKSMTIHDLINGHFVYTEPISDTYSIHILYNLNDKDKTKKIFKGLRQFNSYVPKCTAGSEQFKPIGYVKINMTYE